MAQTFEYTLEGNPARKLEQVRAAAAAKGVIFNGDLKGEQFSDMGLCGTYSISGSTIGVSVATKPFFISWEYIEAQLRGFIEG